MAASTVGELREVQAASAASTCAPPPSALSRRRWAHDKKEAQTAEPLEAGAKDAPVVSGGAHPAQTQQELVEGKLQQRAQGLEEQVEKLEMMLKGPTQQVLADGKLQQRGSRIWRSKL